MVLTFSTIIIVAFRTHYYKSQWSQLFGPPVLYQHPCYDYNMSAILQSIYAFCCNNRLLTSNIPHNNRLLTLYKGCDDMGRSEGGGVMIWGVVRGGV